MQARHVTGRQEDTCIKSRSTSEMPTAYRQASTRHNWLPTTHKNCRVLRTSVTQLTPGWC